MAEGRHLLSAGPVSRLPSFSFLGQLSSPPLPHATCAGTGEGFAANVGGPHELETSFAFVCTQLTKFMPASAFSRPSFAQAAALVAALV